MSDAPENFGRYQLLGRIAAGGMAEIFRARVVGAHGFTKDLVIKRILPHLAADPTFVSMFIDEAKLTARLTHPKIVQVIDFGEVSGQYYIAMELVEGVDCLGVLRACAGRQMHLPTELAVHLAHETLDALDYAHAAVDDEGTPLGIVHRDVSPSNVLISRRGDVKLGDFGIARAAEQQTKTKAGTLKGKYGYMAPEQVVGGDVDGRSDIFSAGIVLSEMLMGRRLFTAPNDLDVLLMVRDVKLDRLEQHGKDIPPPLRAILDRALDRDPARRFQRAGEFRDALADYLFSLRRRVGPNDLGAFVDRVGAGAPDGTPSRGSAPSHASSHGTLAGPATQAKAAAAAREREQAQRLVAQAIGPKIARKKDDSVELIITEETPVESGPVAAAPQAAVPEIGPPPIEASLAMGAAPAGATQAAPPVPPAAPSFPPSFHDDGFVDIGAQIEAELDKATPSLPFLDDPQAATQADDAAARGTDLASALLAVEEAPADAAGTFAEGTPLRAFAALAVARDSGLWLVQAGEVAKEIYFTDGVPVFVASNVSRELFGEYLVAQGAISEAELAMALAVLPRFGGKLGDTLVGLALMRPIEVFRYLTRQVREKLLDVFSWTDGTYRFYRGRTPNRDMFPLGLDAFELMGAASRALGDEQVDRYLARREALHPRATRPPRFPPERFRLGSAPRDLYDHLDGRRSVKEWQAQFTAEEDRRQFGRMLYVLLETELAAA